MNTKFTKLFVLFFLTTVSLFCQISGSWRQVFPENPPGPRYNHYMAPIGNQQVLMIGGQGGGNPHFYANETWLYDYPTNSWTKLDLEFTPDTYDWTSDRGNFMWQISKNRVIISGGRKPWVFDLDSMKWFRLDSANYGFRMAEYLEENLLFMYAGAGRSWLLRLHPNEPFNSPNFTTLELINDESLTKRGPAYSYPSVFFGLNNSPAFVHNNNFQNITYIHSGEAITPTTFMGMAKDVWNGIDDWYWFFLNGGTDTLRIGREPAYSNITNNLTLIYNEVPLNYGDYYDSSNFDKKTHLLEYVPATRSMNAHTVEKEPNPGYFIRGHRVAKIKDGVVMLFGGMPYNSFVLSNKTWIFELDTVSITDNYNEPVKIYTLGHNVYLLGDEIENAILYNVLGQKISEYENSTIDLNSLPMGLYFLHYIVDNSQKIVKLLKK